MRFLSKWRQIRVVPHGHGQAHSNQHGILLCLLQFALFFGDAGSLGCFGLIIAFGVPAQVAALLPATNWGHERVAQVVFALRIVLDVFPFELGASSTG